MARDGTKIVTGSGQLIVNPTGVGQGGQSLGYSDTGLFIVWNDTYVMHTSDDTGMCGVAAFYVGGDPVASIVLKQARTPLVRSTRFFGRYTNADGANRIQLPGDLPPGTSILSNSVILEWRPDNPLVDETVLMRKAILMGDATEPTRFSTLNPELFACSFRCYHDTTIASNDAAYKGRQVQVGLAANLVWPTPP